MTGEHYICTHKFFKCIRMMPDKDFPLGGIGLKKLCHTDLFVPLYFSFHRFRNRGRPNSPDGNFSVGKMRTGARGNGLSVASKRLQHSSEKIIQRNIVIPRHRDHRNWELINKSCGFLELRSACSLRPITSYQNQINVFSLRKDEAPKRL